jgi:hypothetical protein
MTIPWKRAFNLRPPGLIAAWCLLLALITPAIASAADSLPSPRRYIPAQDLIAYFEFDGLDAHSHAWKATATYDMLAKTKAGAMIADLATRSSDWVLKNKAGGLLSGADAIALYDHIVQNGFVLALYGRETAPLCHILVLKGIGRAENRDRLERLGRVLLGPERKGGGKIPKPVRIRGRDVYEPSDENPPASEKGKNNNRNPVDQAEPRNQPDWLAAEWSGWLEGEDLIVILTDRDGLKPESNQSRLSARLHQDRVSLVFDTIDGKRPSVTRHPGFAAARSEGNDLKGFEAAGLCFIGPESKQGLLIALSEILDGTNGVQDVSGGPRPPEPARSPSSPPAPVDDEVQRAAASAEALPPVFTEKDLDFMNGPPLSTLTGPDPVSGAPDGIWRRDLQALGLDGISRIVGRYGFQGRAFVTDLRIEAPAPRKGLLSLVDQPHFRTDQLPPVPPGASTFAVSSLGLQNGSHGVLAIAKLFGAAGIDEIGAIEKSAREPLAAADELLKCLGPIGAFMYQSQNGDQGNRDRADPAGYVLLAGVDDSEAFSKALDKFVSTASRSFLDLMGEDPPPTGRKKGFQPQNALLKRLPTPDKGYRLNDIWLDTFELDNEIEPVILVGKSVVVAAANLDLAREVLAAQAHAGERWRPDAELATALGDLPNDLTFLAVVDHRDSRFLAKVQGLPWVAQFLANMSLDDDHGNASGWCFLDLLGIPRPRAFNASVEREKRPRADDLRPFLFPSVVAATADERGYRLITREACPAALLLNDATVRFNIFTGFTVDKGLRFEESLFLAHPILDLVGSEEGDQ